ncbi:MAG: M14 family metallopeptidase [Flavitalea sp.]
MTKKLTALFAALLCAYAISAQSDYCNFQQQSTRINALAKANPQIAKVTSLAKTSGGKEIWMITIGTGNTESKPAIAVVGGVQGNYLIGTELAMSFAEQLVADASKDSIKTLLAKTTYYIFPNMSPDAMEQYFGKLKFERLGNANTTDDDRDGKIDEDEFDDLDGNGKVTWMRIESPVGEYLPHPDDPRVLIKADTEKGQKGRYRMVPEGIDNDKDGMFNEDGAGGVIFNKNHSYKHPSFTKGSGEFAVSEIEIRALLDKLYELTNIYSVVSFGPANNLSLPVNFNPGAVAQRMISGYYEADTKVNATVSELYNNTTGMKDAPKAAATGGDFYSWAYFHYGRYSFSSPGWYVPKAKPDTAKKEKAFTVEDPVANYLRFASSQGITNTFTEWKAYQHPDFEGQKTEIGGIDPFVLINPPFKLLPEITKKHTSFLVKLATLQPEIDILNVKTEKIGSGLTRVTVEVVNKGAMAATSAVGEKSYWLKKVKIAVNTSGNQSVISGKKIQLINNLNGGEAFQLTWLLKGTGRVTIEAGAPTTGTVKKDITL